MLSIKVWETSLAHVAHLNLSAGSKTLENVQMILKSESKSALDGS